MEEAMKWKALALAAVVAASVGSASSCSTPVVAEGDQCSDGKGRWIQDESESLKSGYTVIVRLCVSEGGKVLDLEVD
jgi:hypothetical protein